MSSSSPPEPVTALSVPLFEERDEPTRHAVFQVSLRGPVRSWSVWHRYSAFAALHSDLLALFPATPPPRPLPPKTPLLLASTLGFVGLVGLGGLAQDPAKLDARRLALEQYLQAILHAPDPRWRSSAVWRQFLAIPDPARAPSSALASVPAGSGPSGPSGTSGPSGPSGPSAATAAGADSLLASRLLSMAARTSGDSSWPSADSWMDDLRQLQALVTDIRSEINARARAAEGGDVASVQSKNIQLRKGVATAAERLNVLENALHASDALPPSSASNPASSTKGEIRRRQDLLANLKEDISQITKQALSTPSSQRTTRESAERQELMGKGRHANSSSSSVNSLGGTSTTSTLQGGLSLNRPASMPARSSRKFGIVTGPQETDETRPLDNQGLLQLQRATLDQQESELDSLSSIIRRQREIGLAMSNELDSQNQLLDELNHQVDRVDTNLNNSNKKLTRILKR
ncbi:hypothetical protein BC831DRAFT_451048 [Entophlyctis helioformis]|nr:hypothetical protein BC831DRAFT_451048 [Entophlyctis helioformis]